MAMSEISDRKPTIAELTEHQLLTPDPGYWEWREKKIRAAVADDIAHPEARIPLRDMWKQLGLES